MMDRAHDPVARSTITDHERPPQRRRQARPWRVPCSPSAARVRRLGWSCSSTCRGILARARNGRAHRRPHPDPASTARGGPGSGQADWHFVDQDEVACWSAFDHFGPVVDVLHGCVFGRQQHLGLSASTSRNNRSHQSNRTILQRSSRPGVVRPAVVQRLPDRDVLLKSKFKLRYRCFRMWLLLQAS